MEFLKDLGLSTWISLIILLVVIVFIIVQQWRLYKSNSRKIAQYRDMFAADSRSYTLVYDEDDATRVIGIETTDEILKSNAEFETIKTSINQYLQNNSGASTDFHIIKDIVDRNTEAVASEISTQVPFPLYYGLMGTMSGIIIGVMDLIWSGSLRDLLLAGSSAGIGGIIALLGGVAIAMIASIVGVYLTTKGSNELKNVNADVEYFKNIFLTWTQAELLPELSTSFSEELVRMTEKLSTFNRTFSDNSRFLQSALKEVREATTGQATMLKAVKDLDVVRIADINVRAFANLQECASNIEDLARCLQSSADYVAQVRRLNEKLDDSEARTHAMEEVARYFMEERSQLDVVKAAMATTISNVDEVFNQSLAALREHTRTQVEETIKFSGEEYDRLKQVLAKQSEAVEKRMDELAKITDELRQMGKVKEAMSEMKDAINHQNAKLEKLAGSIQELARKQGGVEIYIPGWFKGMVAVACVLMSLASIAGIAFMVISILK